MSTGIASINSIINALIPAIFGGVTVTILNYFLNRHKAIAEKEKMKAETEKLKLDMDKTKAETDILHLETNRLRSETENKQKETNAALDQHQKQLDWTKDALRKIVAFQPGHFAHLTLCQIHEKLDVYYDDSSSHMKRLLLLLLDNGYLQRPDGSKEDIEFSSRNHGKKLSEIAELSPMAELVLKLRENESKKS